MAEIDPAKLACIHHKVDEVISGNRPLGVDHEWIGATTPGDRMYALELLRWHIYGKARCQAEVKKIITVVQRPGRDSL